MHKPTMDFFEKCTEAFLMPSIILPTRINSSGNHTLIDNIFSNIFSPCSISGTFDYQISDHLFSFLVIPRDKRITLKKKKNLKKRDFKNFNEVEFLDSFKNINWENALNIEKGDVNESLKLFLKIINEI